ncbi:MAG: multi-sensor hybrid histidine kinase [Myxococcales bacterium]|nr:multi-sensor hybrid histidine kinase [Myxococcales bacterium]
MTATRLRVEDLERRLCEAEATIRALLSGEVDAVVDSTTKTPLLLSKAQQALRESEERYRRIIETTNEGVWLINAEQKTTFMNRRMAQMLGCEADMGLGRSLFEFVDDDGRATLGTQVDQAHQVEVRYIRTDKTTMWALLEATPVFDSAGRYEGTFAMVMDITERKKAEKALLAVESQLRQAQKMEAVGRLAGGIAHDFNNILSVILSCGDFLLEDLKPMDPARSDVEEICKAGRRAASLTRQLLMFSRQQVLEPKVLDLAEVAANMESMLRRVLGEDVELVLRKPAQPGRVRVDPGSIEQVIMNLVVNARDAMPTGGRLLIETKNVTIDETFTLQHPGATMGPHVVLSVTDTGSGMDRATQTRIFEPFFTTKEVGKGTGLGLSTVFGIVQQSNGTIRVHSDVGKGTTFTVYLPQVDAPTDTGRSPLPRAAFRGKETILLVEDEEQVRAVARGILKRHGYRVVEMRSAAEAMLYYETHPDPIDMLLTDVVMPQMSGPELARRLTTIRPTLRVLCMSGYTDDSIVRHGVLRAEIAFLQKPFTTETLTQKVREVLDARPIATT